ncbi:hypothetical protein NPIL_47341 [Nephila pilipes]|uniref:Uncharacterized protein n=1 Tax=Nephila pilipes TaxID=299642 RepID=A0A8X6UQ60_NEPPI|nr:hypothetical protein NPIL_47341 [Nephila pilipes]
MQFHDARSAYNRNLINVEEKHPDSKNDNQWRDFVEKIAIEGEKTDDRGAYFLAYLPNENVLEQRVGVESPTKEAKKAKFNPVP